MRSRHRSWFGPNVVALGFVSLFTDMSSELVIPLLPAFLASLGAGAMALGAIEGIADALASVLKLVSGRFADRLGRNRPLVIAGYSLSAVARPLIALSASAGHVLLVRAADRVGKGLRTSPRDALIAKSVRADERGAAFGLQRALDHLGAVLGPAIAVLVLTLWTDDLRMLFLLSAIPGAVAVVVLLLFVKEDPDVEGGPGDEGGAPDALTARAAAPVGVSSESKKLSSLLVPIGIFTLGNASDVFLLLKLGEARAPLTTLPLFWMGLHVVKSTTSVLGGKLADAWGRRRTIVLGFLMYAAVYLGFAAVEDPGWLAVLFLLYGTYHGLTEGPERALVAELAPARRRGGAYGWFHLTLGGLGLLASLMFGALWEAFGSGTAFVTSAILALVAAALLAAGSRRESSAARAR